MSLIVLMKFTISGYLHSLFKEKTNNTFIQLFRYTFAGGIAFIVDFGSLFCLTEFFSIHYLISAAFAFILGLTTNYLLSIIWVFSSRNVGKKWLEFIIFAIIGIIGLGMNEFVIWFFTEKAMFHYLLSKIISTIIVYSWNFFARKYLLFK